MKRTDGTLAVCSGKNPKFELLPIDNITKLTIKGKYINAMLNITSIVDNLKYQKILKCV